MSEDIFDAIIVGAGLARFGCGAGACSRRCTGAGYRGVAILLARRMSPVGVCMHIAQDASFPALRIRPRERMIATKLAFMTNGAMTIDYCNEMKMLQRRRFPIPSYLPVNLTLWLMGQAEEGGAQLITDIRVDINVVQRDGKVVGVSRWRYSGSQVVILADGANSLLAEKLGMVKRVEGIACCRRCEGTDRIAEVGRESFPVTLG